MRITMFYEINIVLPLDITTVASASDWPFILQKRSLLIYVYVQSQTVMQSSLSVAPVFEADDMNLCGTEEN
jgi:hypothetical protein